MSTDGAVTPTPTSGFDPRLRVLLMAASGTLMATGGMVFPLLAELQDRYHFATFGLGFIAAAGFLGSITAQLTMGRFSDRGHSRRMMLMALGLAGLGLLTFATGSSLWQFVIARSLTGFAQGTFYPACRAVFATADRENAGKNLGRLNGIDTLMFTSSPLLSAALERWFGLKAPFFTAAAIVAVMLVFLFPRLPHIPPRAQVDARPPRLLTKLLRVRGVRVAMLLALLLSLPMGMYDALWARYLGDRGASPLFIGATLTLYGIPFVLFSATGARIIDRVGPLRASTIAMTVMVPLTVLYAVLVNPWAIVALFMFEAMANAIASPSAQVAMARACPHEWIAAGQGLSGATGQMVAAVAALSATPMYRTHGAVPTFSLLAAALVALITAAHVIDRRAGGDGLGATEPTRA